MESDRLLESVYSQLPCTALCVPALPPGPEAAERLLVALYKVAWTSQACPVQVHPRDYVLRLCSWGAAYACWDRPPAEVAAYVRSGQVGAVPGRRSRPDDVATGVAAQCLHVIGSAINGRLESHTAQAVELVSKRYAAAALLLEAPGALDAAQHQLEALRRRHTDLPPMTAQQLLFACYMAVSAALSNLLATTRNAAQLQRNQQQAGGQVAGAAAGPPTREMLMHIGLMSETAQASSARLLQLDPNRVEGHVAAAHVAVGRQDFEAAWRLYERGLELARQQRSNWFITLCCMRVIKQMLVLPGACDSQEALAQVSGRCWWAVCTPLIGCGCHLVPSFPYCCSLPIPDLSSQVQALLREAEAAWKPCTKLLPERWVQTVRGPWRGMPSLHCVQVPGSTLQLPGVHGSCACS